MTTSDEEFVWSDEPTFEREKLCADKLNRGKYAKFLTDYLNDVGQRDNGYVINLNAEWGAGKTWFLKRWCCQQLKNDHPVAYIDAWKNDFSETPMLTVVSGILSSLEADANTKSLKNRRQFAEKFRTISKRALPTLATGLAKQYLGVDLNDDGKADSDAAEGLGRMFEKALEAHDQTLKGVEQYRSEIARCLNEATTEDGTSGWRTPMYVFIDELDRCRPTYAIELLETVKHLFEIKGIVFVIATNTDQLQHSIKAVYGEGFDANRYLYRFFNRSFTLKAPDMKSLILSLDSFQSLSRKLRSSGDGAIIIKPDNLGEFFAGLSEAFGFDLRTTYQWLDQLDFIFSNLNNVNRYFWGAVALMVAMRLSDPDLYYQHFHIKRRESSRMADHKDILSRSFGNRVIKEHRAERFLKMQVKVDHLPKSQDQMAGIPEIYSGHVQMKEKLPGNWVENIQRELSSEDMDTDHYKIFWEKKDQSNPVLLNGFYVAINNYRERGATFEGYINLVDMASDLE